MGQDEVTALKVRVVKLEERRKTDAVKNNADHKAIKTGVGEIKKLVGNHLSHAKWFNYTITAAFVASVMPYIVEGVIKMIKLL